MHPQQITIAVDAMGGDKAPSAAVRGAVDAARDLEVKVVLVGREQDIERELEGLDPDPDKVSIVHAPDVVTMSDAPTVVFRKKRDASIMIAFSLAKEKKVHGVVSAGNSGATMASAVFTLGMVPGLDRPAIAGCLPTPCGFTMVIDIGANIKCKPHQLFQFGIMGDVYLRHIDGIKRPRVGLLSIGEEDTKGNELVKLVHHMLKDSPLNFVGNVEGRDVFSGAVDLVVCDGFVGNVLLKVSEGLGGALFDMIENEVQKLPSGRQGFETIQPAFLEAKKRIDYEEVGGAPLLGINGVGIIGHGASTPKAIKNAVRVAQEMVIKRVEYFLAEGIKEYENVIKSLAFTIP
jgi:phosphate acyltransferase